MRISPETLEQKETKEILQYLISKHSPHRLTKLQNYYEGEHNILKRQMYDPAKPNNKLVHNIPALITSTVVGYFIGKPVSYAAVEEADDDYAKTLQNIYDDNDEQDHNAEIAKNCSVKGVGYELIYTDEEAQIKFCQLNPENVIYVETDEIDAKPAMAVRIYEVDDMDEEDTTYYDVYTDYEIITYRATKQNESVSLTEIDRQEHWFGEVPVVRYQNNKEMLGDFEGVIDLVDAYNQSQSDTANDFEYFTDAYLLLVGATLDEEQRKMMKESRIIGLPDKECNASFMVKELNDTAIENYKTRIRRDIHTIARVPDLTDEQFGGNITGVAISFKLWGTDQLVATKDRKFKQGLHRRIKLITNILNTQGNQWDWRSIEVTFSRNMPQNLAELALIVSQLKNIVSDETLLAIIPFVENVAMEQERLEKAREGIPDLDNLVGELDEPTEEV